jgi:antitoxin component of MazEF toxin-antitoxin module
MSINRKLSKCGNSTALVIPPAVLEMLGWKIGDTELELTVEGKRLIVQAEPPPKFKLFGGTNAKEK